MSEWLLHDTFTCIVTHWQGAIKCIRRTGSEACHGKEIINHPILNACSHFVEPSVQYIWDLCGLASVLNLSSSLLKYITLAESIKNFNDLFVAIHCSQLARSPPSSIFRLYIDLTRFKEKINDHRVASMRGVG